MAKRNKEEQECASIEHLEIFSMTSGEGQKKSRGTLKEQERSKGTQEAEQEHMRGTTRGQKMYSRGTRDEQQRHNRGPDRTENT